MSKYIEIDTALLKTVAIGGISAKALWKRIMQQPSIDIVHCGECKYFNEDKCWNLKGLNKTDGVVKADDFCSYGERKDDE